MDWLRRNWPDLLIGLALVAVIAGIIATLISGGSFFPAGNRTAENPGQGTAPLTGPASAGSQSNEVSTDDRAAAAGAGAAAVDDAGSPAASAGDAAAAADADGDAAGDSPASAVTATPDTAGAAGSDDAAAGDGDTTTAPDQSSAALPVAVLPPAGQANDDQAAAAASSSASSVQDGATPSASSSVSSTAAADAGADSGIDIPASADAEAPYRVSVGAYANRANAEGQAATFRAAGYPVFIGEQGDLNIVLVGPYDSESEARSVAAAIRNADFGVTDPTVYEFTADDQDQAVAQAPASTSTVSSSAASQAASQPGSEAVVADDDTVITSSPATADGVRYLQAGAYGSRDSSLPQRDRLEGLGFVVTERVENDLVKLLIGPFDAANLENAESRLEAAGIASFPR